MNIIRGLTKNFSKILTYSIVFELLKGKAICVLGINPLDTHKHKKKPVSEETSIKVLQLSKKMGIKRPISVWKTEDTPHCQGSNLPGSQAQLFLNEKQNNTQFIAHELVHLKRNHAFQSLTSSLLLCGLLVRFLPRIGYTAFLTCVVGCDVLIGRKLEMEADRLGAKFATTSDLADNVALHSNILLNNGKSLRALRPNLYNRLRIQPNGDERWSLSNFPFIFDSHPPPSKSIKVLKEEIANRSDVLPLEVFLEEDPKKPLKQIALSDTEHRELRSLINGSHQSNIFINLKKIIYRPSKKKDQIEIWKNESTSPITYDYESTPSVCVLDLIQHVIQQPNTVRVPLPYNEQEKNIEEITETLEKKFSLLEKAQLLRIEKREEKTLEIVVQILD